MHLLILLGSILMFIAVILGAFGAHALKKKLSPDMMKVYETGIHYHIAHALGLLLLGLLTDHLEDTSMLILSGWFMLAGVVLFSGSLYVLSVTGIRKLGAITPLGGVAFLIGWALVFIKFV